MSHPTNPEPSHVEKPGFENDRLHRQELVPELRREAEKREKLNETLWEGVGKYITGKVNWGTADGTKFAETAFQNVEAKPLEKASFLSLAKDVGEVLFFSKDGQYAPLVATSLGKSQLARTQDLLLSNAPTSVKVFGTVASMLTLAYADGGAPRNRALYGKVVSSIRQVNNLGGIETIRFHPDILEQKQKFQDKMLYLDQLQKVILDSAQVQSLSAHLDPVNEHILNSWIMWPDCYMWKAVMETIRDLPPNTVASDTITLYNQIAGISPESANVEDGSEISRVAKLAAQSMEDTIQHALQQDAAAPPAEIFKDGMTRLSKSMYEIYTKDKDLLPPRRTVSFVMVTAAAVGADRLQLN